jgi:hypothetical protein
LTALPPTGEQIVDIVDEQIGGDFAIEKTQLVAGMNGPLILRERKRQREQHGRSQHRQILRFCNGADGSALPTTKAGNDQKPEVIESFRPP